MIHKYKAYIHTIEEIHTVTMIEFVGDDLVRIETKESDGAVFTLHSDFLMLFTGFSDRNGKEIYDSDILEDFEEHYYYNVVWNKSQGGWFCDGEWLSDMLEQVEVIGNLLLEPELTTKA